ncbi:MAG: aminoacyl-histidine dipeptidase [Ignavibacteria bacterium]|jgi:dipeptidase D
MSKEAIAGLKPELIWEYFYGISQVPRPSKKEEKIRAHVREFANKNNFQFQEDKVGNIVIKIPATEGKENSPVVVLQGHLDMVCEKNKGTEHDFENDPIELIKDGEWIKANGTTLGADNGIGVAAAMAAATDKEAVHGPLEILCTVDEETGMTGVSALQPGFITGRILLNMDSEEDGVFYIGCSGGQDTIGIYEIQYTDPKVNLLPYKLMVTGLKGGHSGLDIHQGRANAIKLLARLLLRLEEVKYKIADFDGGSLRNAIPREAEVTFLINPIDENEVKEIIQEFIADSLLEYKNIDGGLHVNFERKDSKIKKVFRKKFAKKIINTILAMPHGVLSMSPDIPGLVETSTNLATIKIEGGKLRLGTSQRSAIDAAKMNAAYSVAAVLSLSDAEVVIGDAYPGWQPNIDSELLKISKEVYKKTFGNEPEIKAIHAGLETGLLGAKYPGIDMISFGPTIQGAHSPTERINIKDVEKFYTLLKAILEKFA